MIRGLFAASCWCKHITVGLQVRRPGKMCQWVPRRPGVSVARAETLWHESLRYWQCRAGCLISIGAGARSRDSLLGLAARKGRLESKYSARKRYISSWYIWSWIGATWVRPGTGVFFVGPAEQGFNQVTVIPNYRGMWLIRVICDLQI